MKDLLRAKDYEELRIYVCIVGIELGGEVVFHTKLENRVLVLL